ncbi:MAG: hypothetical protein ACLPPF_10565 [Rhodomicrobium sp.]
MQPPDWKLEDDRKIVTLTFDAEPRVSLKLAVDAVDDILANLGEFRGGMTPEVKRDWAPGQKVRAVPDPRWYTELDLMRGDSLLHIRDPRFGWLSYLLPREEARKLGQYLIEQANTPDPPQPKGKAN